MIQVIVLPNGRKCRLGTYARAWKALLAAAPNSMWPGFDYFPETAAHILGKMRYGLHDRINRHIPNYGLGRKWDHDYQTHLWRDSRRLRDIANRIKVYQFESEEAHSRFANLLADRRETA